MPVQHKTDLETVLSRPNGAKFFRIDLHNHTPADASFHCKTFSIVTDEEKAAFAHEYVRYAKEEKGLDIIGITDHNETAWVDLITEAGKKVGLTVLPGVELGANEGKRQIHYLALFGPNTAGNEIDHFMSSIGLTPKNRFDEYGNPRLSKNSCTELTRQIATAEDGLPGIAIAAHVTRKNGMLHELEGESRVMAWEDPNLIAIEIPGAKSALSGFNARLIHGEMDAYNNRLIACINSSDGRGIGETATNERSSIGDNACRIRLSHTGENMLSALRHAFIDHDSRIRLEGDYVDEKYSRIIGITVENGFLSGSEQSTPFLAHLNPNLNTIIGGRGTGKSSLLEALRFVFDVEAKTAQTQAQSKQALSVTLPAGARVKAWYETADGMTFEICREPGKAPQVFNTDSGKQINIHPKNLISDGLPLEIYGQKEVYEIANRVEFQLSLIDSYIAEPLRDIRRKENDLLRQIEANGQELLRLENEMAENEQTLADLPSIKLEIERLETDETLNQLQRKKELEEEKLELENLMSEMQKRENWLEQKRPSPSNTQQSKAFKKGEKALSEIDALIDDALQALKKDVAKIWQKTVKERELWQKEYDRVDAEYKVLLEQHGDSLSIERYFDLQEKRSELERLEEVHLKTQDQLAQTKEIRHTLLSKLTDLRDHTLFGVRQQKIEQLNHSLSGSVKINLIKNGNLEQYAEFLASLFKKFNGRITKKVVDSIVEADKSPLQLAQTIRQEKNGPQDKPALGEIFGISDAYRSRLTQLDEQALFELEVFDIPDRPDIQLKVGEAYRSLNPQAGIAGLSTGQKCTAILSLILIERNTPLIIDQPEDDLDNAFIYTDIVKTLRQEKERRQFIIATHNANIPVSGDAELIILMKANENHGWIEWAGSIDDPTIREPVENILEGGREAFRLRQQKYDI